MARTQPSTYNHHLPVSPALLLPLQAAWLTAVVAVCLALCTIHCRRASRRKLRSCPASSPDHARECNGVATPAKVSPTPRDAKADEDATEQKEEDHADNTADPITTIDVGTHGPIAPVFAPEPPRRSLSMAMAKHAQFTDRLARMRSMHKAKEAEETLWTKTIILGDRCRVPNEDDENQRKNYRPRRPRSVPVSRTNSFSDMAGLVVADGRTHLA